MKKRDLILNSMEVAAVSKWTISNLGGVKWYFSPKLRRWDRSFDVTKLLLVTNEEQLKIFVEDYENAEKEVIQMGFKMKFLVASPKLWLQIRMIKLIKLLRRRQLSSLAAVQVGMLCDKWASCNSKVFRRRQEWKQTNWTLNWKGRCYKIKSNNCLTK